MGDELGYREITLPVSGLTVRVADRRLKVLDSVKAADMCGDFRNPIRMLAARAVVVTSMPDGRAVIFEDVLQWDEDDLNAIVELRESPDFVRAPGGPSSPSPASSRPL